MGGEELRDQQGHPLLRGGRSSKDGKYSHGLSSSQMGSLAAICGALIPSLPLAGDAHVSNGKWDPPGKHIHLRDFYLASASQPPIPDEVAELLNKRVQKEGVFLVKLILWLLSSRLGTLVLCGSLCICRRFPFINRFSEMAVENREEALKRWNRETTVVVLRLAFVVVRILCFFVFYSMAWSWERLYIGRPQLRQDLRGNTVPLGYMWRANKTFVETSHGNLDTYRDQLDTLESTQVTWSHMDNFSSSCRHYVSIIPSYGVRGFPFSVGKFV